MRVATPTFQLLLAPGGYNDIFLTSHTVAPPHELPAPAVHPKQ